MTTCLTNCLDTRGIRLQGPTSCTVNAQLTATITHASTMDTTPRLVYIDILRGGQPVATYSGYSSAYHPFTVTYTVEAPGNYSARGRNEAGQPFPYGNPPLPIACTGAATERCALDFYESDGQFTDASWDTANCFIKPLPRGVLGYVYNEGTSVYTQRRYCQSGGFDSANCYLFSPPTGSTTFIWGNAFYYTPKPGNACDAPATFDGANCYVMPIPSGTRPFIWDNNGYLEPSAGCHPQLEAEDQGNRCYLGKVPVGTQPFVWDTNLYYAE